MHEFLRAYLFHWTPDRAIWLGGHTLPWDARCAGIYAGFAAGAACGLVVRWRVPSPRTLAVAALFLVPLFADVLSLSLGLRAPSNDVRFLTGLIFGGVLSVALVPAVRSLACADSTGRDVDTPAFIAVPAALAGEFILAQWDDGVAFRILAALCYAGFFALASLLGAGVLLAVHRAR